MNFRKPLLRLCTTGCGLLMVLSLVFAPQAAQASIDGNIKTSLDADKGAQSAAISLEVKTRVIDLGGAVPAARSTAREGLIIEVNAPGGTSYSSAFLDTYSKELNDQLAPLLDNPDVAVRLNAAIVVARVAERVDNSYLLPITEKLLADKSDAVVNWGLKAARYVLPPLLQAGLPAQQKKLMADIEAHASDPQMLRLVYEALSLNFQNIKSSTPNFAKMFGTAVPEVLNVLEARLAEYHKGIPPEPIADFPAPLFLVDSRVWGSANAATQLRIVQDLSDLVSLGGHRLTGAPGAERDQLAALVRQAASAIYALAYQKNLANLQAQLQPLLKLDPNDPALIQKVESVYPALKADPAWANLKPPPTIGGATSTSAPVAAQVPG